MRCAGIVLALLLSGGAPAVSVQGTEYPTWQAYFESAAFRDNLRRCGVGVPPKEALEKGATGDCTTTLNVPAAEYAPARAHYRIPVVFHVLTNTAGEGAIDPALIASQVDVLNEDYRALSGTAGGLGRDTNIEFYLADTDPQGGASSGITVHANDAWFADSGDYWTSTSWDAARYVNIYTNQAQGLLGYTPFRPAQGNGVKTATAEDRIVLLWSVVGRAAPAGPPYDQGRTLTHEMGHYLGLEHPFLNGCGSASAPLCHQTGDLICDTPPVAAAQIGCPVGTTSCGNPDPTENYMTYVDDTCMREFTLEQAKRMHCTLDNWRPALGERTYVAEGEGEGEGGEGEGEGEGEGQGPSCASTPIQDAGFELGPFSPNWTATSTNFGSPVCQESVCGLFAGLGVFEGTYWAWFGGAVGRVEDASLTQTVTFPSAPGMLLRFYFAMPTPGATGYFRLRIDGTIIFEASERDASSYSAYTPVLLDVSAYADGASHELRLEAHEDAVEGKSLNFFVDSLCTETFTPPPHFTADTDGDQKIGLSELMRVIQLYNAGGLHCDATTEDGYAPGDGEQTCAHHASDYTPADWVISLSELLRVIQFYNVRGFAPCAEGEDGFCPQFL